MRFTDDTLKQMLDVNDGALWIPSRKLTNLSDTAAQTKLDAVAADVLAQPDTPSAPAGAPEQVLSPSVTESPTKVQGRTMSEISVSFSRDFSDQNFGTASVWFTNYRGSETPWLVAQGSDAPITFICETTGESVTVTVQAMSLSGTPADFDTAPTCTVLLDGVVSAPPPPTIAQNLIAIGAGIGWQFTFNCLTGLLEDVVDGYWIYRNTVNVAPVGASLRYKYVRQPATGIGAYVFQDLTATTYYYWVSAVNTSGLESTLAAVAIAGGGGGVGTTGQTTQHWPTTYTVTDGVGHSSQSEAWDGNETTYARAAANAGADCGGYWSGFSATGVPTAISIKVMTDANISGKGSAGTCTFEYSTDAGASWSALVTQSVTTAAAYYSVSIPAGTTLANLYVKGLASGGTNYRTAAQRVYEVRIEVTT